MIRLLIENILIFIVCLLMVIAISVILMKKQAANIKITRTDFGKKKEKERISFVHISDLHIPLLPVGFKKICGIIADEKPSFVVITGDLCSEKYMGRLESFLYMLSNSAKCPIYITLGNHDNAIFIDNTSGKKAYIANMESISPLIKVLEDDYVTFQTGDRKIIIAGLADYRDDVLRVGEEKKRYVQRLLKVWRIKAEKDNASLIIASHNPDIMLYVEERTADLFLFGHTHGGQIWLPFNFEFILLREDTLPHKGYVYGRYVYNNNDMYITCGVGCTLIPLRFRSTPEICVHSI